MKEEIVTLKTAELAKEKGFIAECTRGYDENDKLRWAAGKQEFWTGCYYKSQKYVTLAPTQSLLQKWLREEHNIVVYILPHAPQKRIDDKVNLYSACLWYKNEYQSEIRSYKTYEQALEKALQEALKLI